MNFCSKLVVSIVVAFAFHRAAYCQTMPAIQLDRPDQTECSFITPVGFLQLENGVLYEQSSGGKLLTLPTSLIKYGINERVEFRLIAEYAGLKQPVDTKFHFGLVPVTVGFKAALLEEKGSIPKTSFIGQLTSSNLGSGKWRTNYLAPAFRFTMQHTLPANFTLSYNIGVEWNGESPAETYIYTLSTGYSISERLGSYIEVFGFLPKSERPRHNADGGITLLLNNNCMADLSAGIGLTDNSFQFYASFGFSFRFKVAKKASNPSK